MLYIINHQLKGEIMTTKSIFSLQLPAEAVSHSTTSSSKIEVKTNSIATSILDDDTTVIFAKTHRPLSLLSTLTEAEKNRALAQFLKETNRQAGKRKVEPTEEEPKKCKLESSNYHHERYLIRKANGILKDFPDACPAFQQLVYREIRRIDELKYVKFPNTDEITELTYLENRYKTYKDTLATQPLGTESSSASKTIS
jgi:hypothetical protein